ncbi:hypothetical protein WMY93_024266 [Mugilogobius chulae]|uniref:Uncharacterized protein n=1 Tax=Mugilogobius chulae TaxID=88201 RepID=A0AAW0N5Y0_9GOBI
MAIQTTPLSTPLPRHPKIKACQFKLLDSGSCHKVCVKRPPRSCMFCSLLRNHAVSNQLRSCHILKLRTRGELTDQLQPKATLVQLQNIRPSFRPSAPHTRRAILELITETGPGQAAYSGGPEHMGILTSNWHKHQQRINTKLLFKCL